MKKRIYLCGGISNLHFKEAMGWRTFVADYLNEMSGNVSVFNPLLVDMVGDKDKKDAVAMKYELDMLRKSDLVVVYLNDPSSLGSMAEIAIAYENRIPVLGIMPWDVEDVHPWIKEMCDYIFDDLMEFFDYVVDNYLEV